MKLRNLSRSLLLTLTLLALVPVAAIGEQSSAPGTGGKPFAGDIKLEQRHSLLNSWKQQRARSPKEASVNSARKPLVSGGTPIIGRASMVLNTAGDLAFTRDFLGEVNNCEVDLRNPIQWQASTAYQTGDYVRGSDGNNHMAQNSGTSGGTEPAWNSTFGATNTDAGVTWINTGTRWLPGVAYTAGMVVSTSITQDSSPGFSYQAQAGATGNSGANEPFWPITAGGTVVDNTGITWKAIGYFPGSFRNCNPLQMMFRPAAGSDVVIASEGDAVGTAQLSGWGEFIAMNASGRTAFKTGLVDNLAADDDEAGTSIVLAGPGAGALSSIAKSGSTIGGRFTCGLSTMVAMNDSGQVVYDGYAYRPGTAWQPNHAYGSGDRVVPTAPVNGLFFTAENAGTSGATEPVWPAALFQPVTDGGVTWAVNSVNASEICDEDNHGLYRFTSGPGNQLLTAIGSALSGSTVAGFGTDVYDANGTSRCSACTYENIDGVINSLGHVPVVLTLADDTQGVYNFSGPNTAVTVARGGGANPFTTLFPRASINNLDQVAFKGTSTGIDKIVRFTPPSTSLTVVSAGDDIGTRSGGAATGVTFTTFGNFFDLNNQGDLVFEASISGGFEGYYFWKGSSHVITEIYRQVDDNTLASEMITVNDSDVVAYVTGNQGQDTGPGEDEHEDWQGPTNESPNLGAGLFFWQPAHGTTKAITTGDVIGGQPVSSIYSQHRSFVRRQLNENGCVATSYHVAGDDPGFDCDEGETTNGCGSNGGQLLVSCASATACPTILVSPPTLPGGTQGVAYTQTITASGGTAPYTFFLASGALPDGLSLDSAGHITGTPTSSNTFDFTITASATGGCSGSRSYEVVIGDPGQVTVTISPDSLGTTTPGGTLNYTVTISAAQGTDTIVTLTSSNPGVASVPATITILANQTTASFTVTGVSNGGPVTITAALPGSFGAQPATVFVLVTSPVVATPLVPTLNLLALALLGLLLAAASWLTLKK